MVRDGGPGGGPNDGPHRDAAADAKISSSDIRDGLAAGDVARVNDLLGRRFSLHGPVVRGRERGRGIGFPTANIAVGPDQALPATGVYATLASIDGRLRPSATNIGVRPTFRRPAHGQRRVSHPRLRRRPLRPRPAHRLRVAGLRPEVKFDGVEALTAQVARDCRDARAAIAAAAPPPGADGGARP